MTSNQPQVSLGELFSTGEALYKKLENSQLSTSDTKYQEDVRRALECFSHCGNMVENLSLFSTNETLDDINTNDLRFLLVEAYLGSLTTKLISEERLDVLNIAKRHHQQFLLNLEMYEMLGEEELKYLEDQSNYIKKDAAKTRETKIARFKRRIGLEKELKELQEKKLALGEQDDEVKRKLIIKLIELFIQKSIEELAAIQQEIELLEQMKNHRDQEGTRAKLEKVNDGTMVDSSYIEPSGPLLSNKGRPLRPFTITNQRETIRQQVFRPGWRLPTMTIDEYLQQEEQRGNIIKEGGKMPESKVVDDNDEAAIDAETYKARRLDDFKDTNPRGWGNRMGKG
ncbi:hypothetical protein G9A89_022966 [Geosiphon pyriformis]|nr:hypothetical protein G9A89_022966 [Geosiphon pyriformis]